MSTIVDVARQARVSIATVSRVQRGTARVRPETRYRVLAAVSDLGLSIPRDVAITGWDDISTARFISPGQTTVRQPMRALGARSAATLIDRIRGERTLPRHQVLPTSLVIGASCGCSHGKEVRDQ